PKPKQAPRTLTQVRQQWLSRIRERVLVCGNLLSWGPHGMAVADNVAPGEIWPALAEALYRIRRADRLFGNTGLILVKDLTDDAQTEALRRFSYRPFDTEPNMVLDLPDGWHSFEDYLASLRTDYSKSIRKTHKKIEAAGFSVERLSPSQVRAEGAAVHALYQQVHEGQKLRLVT